MAILRLSIAAFVEKEETATAVLALREDRRLLRSNIVAHMGGIPGAVAHLGETAPPSLLIVESTLTGDALFEALDSLSGVCDPATKVVLVGPHNDIALYKRLTGLGLSDYLSTPIATAQVLDTIDRIFEEASEEGLGRVVAFIGARGGVGNSTIAANTAYALAHKFKEPVVLIDLDVAFGSEAIALNLQPRQNLMEALAQPDRLDDVLLERFLVRYDDHLSVLLAPASLDGGASIRSESFDALLKLVRRMAAFVVLDLPHQWQPWVHEVLLDANEVVVTAYPDLMNLRDTKNLFDLLGPKRGAEAPLRLVFNRVGISKKSELSAKDFEESIRVKPVVGIPFEPAVFGAALNNGQLAVEASKGSKSAAQINVLADIVSARMPVAKAQKRSLLSMLGIGR